MRLVQVRSLTVHSQLGADSAQKVGKAMAEHAHIIADQHSEIGRLRQLLAQAERRLVNAKIAADGGRADIAAEWIDMTMGLFAQRK